MSLWDLSNVIFMLRPSASTTLWHRRTGGGFLYTAPSNRYATLFNIFALIYRGMRYIWHSRFDSFTEVKVDITVIIFDKHWVAFCAMLKSRSSELQRIVEYILVSKIVPILDFLKNLYPWWRTIIFTNVATMGRLGIPNTLRTTETWRVFPIIVGTYSIRVGAKYSFIPLLDL